MNIICIIQEKQQIIKRKLKLKYFKETNNADFLHIIHGHDISFYFFAILKSLRFSRYLVSSSIISKNFKPSYLIHSVSLKTVFIEGIWKCHTAWKMSKVSVFSCIRTRKISVCCTFSYHFIWIKDWSLFSAVSIMILKNLFQGLWSCCITSFVLKKKKRKNVNVQHNIQF